MNLPPLSSVFLLIETANATCSELLLKGSVRGIGVVKGPTKLQVGKATVLVTNLRQEPQHLTEGTAMGHIKELESQPRLPPSREDATSSQQNRTPSADLEIDKKLPPAERQQLLELLDNSGSA